MFVTKKDTPLHMAVFGGTSEAIDAILSFDGIDASAQDNSKMTALDWARNLGNSIAVSILEWHQ